MVLILIADPIATEGIDVLRQHGEVEVLVGQGPDRLRQRLVEASALLVRSETHVTAELIEAAPHLRVVGRAGAGVDNIDLEAATRRGIVVVNAPGGNTVAAAEHALALLMSVARRVPQADAALKQGRWERSKFIGVEVHGKTLGLVGLGRVGSEVARRAIGLEMHVLAYDPYVPAERMRRLGLEPADLETVLAQSDFISLHVPLTDETRGLLNAKRLTLLKPTAYLINAARGGLIDEQALIKALDAGQLAGAGLDVFSKEPATDNPLAAHPKVVATPHLGASTVEAQSQVAVQVAEQMAAVLKGRPAQFAVNAPLFPVELGSDVEPYLDLTHMLGNICRQLAEGGYRAVEVDYHGGIAEAETAALTAAAVRGILAPVSGEPVTLVNAHLVATARGLEIVERKSQARENHTNLIVVSIVTDQGRSSVGGTVMDGQPHVVRVDEYWVDVTPSEGYMLVTRHEDRPGIIGKVGTILGEADINISSMQVGRQQRRGHALMMLTVDEPVSPEVAACIRNVGTIASLKVVKL
jgi:D-3-phosphoglycerate dehydrogenase